MSNTVVNKKLYKKVIDLANIKFASKTGIYRSSWIVNTYKKLGGKYSGIKPKLTGLRRWYKEKWVNLNNPNKEGYEPCGRKNLNDFSMKKEKYPLCRPTYKITSKTPKTYKELSKISINKAKKQKTGPKYIKFT